MCIILLYKKLRQQGHRFEAWWLHSKTEHNLSEATEKQKALTKNPVKHYDNTQDTSTMSKQKKTGQEKQIKLDRIHNFHVLWDTNKECQDSTLSGEL